MNRVTSSISVPVKPSEAQTSSRESKKRIFFAALFLATLGPLLYRFYQQRSLVLEDREIARFPCPPPSPNFSPEKLRALNDTWTIKLILDPLRGEDRLLIREKAVEWAESHCGKRARKLAYWVLNHIKYVSVEEFEHQLAETVGDFNEQLKKDPKYIAIIISPQKSSAWVAAMALPYLDHPPVDIIIVDDLLDALKKYRDVRQVAIFDDGTYSGIQMQYQIHMAYTEGAERFKGNFKVHVVIPYHVDTNRLFLQKDVQQSGNIKVATYERLVPVKELLPEEDHALFTEMFRDDKQKMNPVLKRPLVYFSHMTPDNLSTLDALRSGASGQDISTSWEAFEDLILTTRSCAARARFEKTPFLPPADPPYKHQSPKLVRYRYPKNHFHNVYR